GATVVAKKNWMAISEADRTKMLEIAGRIEKQLQVDVPKQDAFAVALMSKQGLKVTKAAGPEWQKEGEALAQTMRGQMVPSDIFDLALMERNAYRQRKPAAK